MGLGAASAEATGQVKIAGKFSGQLAPATAESTALVEIHVQLAASLASSDLDGAGKLGHPPVSGTLAAVLHGSQVATISTVAVEGAAAITLIGSQAHTLAAVAVTGQSTGQLGAATVEGIGVVAWILALIYGSVCGPQETGTATGAGGPGFVQGPGNG